MSLKELWVKIPDSWKVEGKSIWHTFIAAVGVELGLQLHGASFSLEQGFLLAVGAAALRSGIKAVGQLAIDQFSNWFQNKFGQKGDTQ